MDEGRDWPFGAWLKIAILQLGISPSEFWEMSLVDWFALARTQAAAPMTQDDLIKMEEIYDPGK